jgi:hypothetical protein
VINSLFIMMVYPRCIEFYSDGCCNNPDARVFTIQSDGMNLQKSDEIVTVMNNMFKAYT